MVFYLNQILITIQGEGSYVGKPSLLIRTQGCNLTCKFCDSKNTWTFVSKYKVDETNYSNIADKVTNYFKNYKITNLILTGGEPLLHFSNDIYKSFISRIINNTPSIETVEIETNTTWKIEELDLTFLCNKQIKFNLSPKCIDNHFLIENIEYLKKHNINFDIKLVHISDVFIEKFCSILDKDIFNKIYILPLSNNRESYINGSLKTIEFCLKHGLNFSPREHLILFDKDNKEYNSFPLE